ncbi:MAG TPA: ATP-binding protein [Drouetiella sp.]|jgi:signal transduction histidine kinase
MFLQRPWQCEQASAVVLPPRLQSLLTMKQLWAEYSALLVRTKIGHQDEPASGRNVSVGEQTPASYKDVKTAAAVRAHDISARWTAEARAIQFEFEFKAVENERRRVAKELHDESLPVLARLIRSVQSVASPNHQSLVDEVYRSIAAFRDLLGELHPVDLEELGLVSALDNICKRCVRLCGRFVLFIEQTESCHLSELQQLCLYRAIQALLRMFAESQNDMLMIKYERISNQSVITVRCADKLVSSAEWITSDRSDFDAFEAWCSLAGAKVLLGSRGTQDQFPNDLVISVAEEAPEMMPQNIVDLDDLSQARLNELDVILTHARDEWARLINRDRALFESLAVAAERKKISEDIDRFIVPRLEQIITLADRLNDAEMTLDVHQRMRVIVSGVAAVMADLHPRLLAEAGLLASIQALVDRFRRASLIETKLHAQLLSEQIFISQEAKFAMYRVTQEALTNIEKHSGATHAIVVVTQNVDRLSVSIEDNGRGIQGTRNTLSRGLKNIRERAAGIGAEVSWESALSFGSGTLVTISLHWPPQ